MKQRIISSLFAILLSMAGVQTFAYDAEVDGIYYNFTGNEAMVTYLSNNSSTNWTAYTGSVTIPQSVVYNGFTYSVTSIGDNAFCFCTGLISVSISSSVTSIGDWAFSSCWSLTSVNIPNSVTSIGRGAFGYCIGLTSIVVDAANSHYDSRNNCNAIIETSTNTLIAGCKNTVIPNSVTSIGYGAFIGFTDLTTMTFPSSVTSIGDYAFNFCISLPSVTIPNSVTSIGNYAFYDCSGLMDVFCKAGQIPATQSRSFDSSRIKDATLHVSASAIDAYRTTAPWSGFGTIVPIEEDEDDLQSYLNSLEDTEDSFDGSTYRREFKNGDWQALYVPFEMNYSDFSAKFDVARISEYDDTGQIGSGLDGFVLRASMVESGKVDANYPYLIRAKSKTGATLTVQVNENVDMISNSIQVYNHTYIRGNYNKMYKLKADGYYRLQGGKLSIPNSDSEMLPPYRWYLNPPRNMPTRITIEINGEETTNMRNIATDDDVDSPTVYDLQGRKVSNGTQLKNGIYIVNGKKQVIKQKR